jgi:hypothetical protein
VTGMGVSFFFATPAFAGCALMGAKKRGAP